MQSTATIESNGVTHHDAPSAEPAPTGKARVPRDQSVPSADYAAQVRDMLNDIGKADRRAALDALVAVVAAGDAVAGLAAFDTATASVRHLGTLRAISDGVRQLAPLAARCKDASTVHAAVGAMLG